MLPAQDAWARIDLYISSKDMINCVKFGTIESTNADAYSTTKIFRHSAGL